MLQLVAAFSMVGIYIARLKGSPEPIGVGVSLGSIVFAHYIAWLITTGGYDDGISR